MEQVKFNAHSDTTGVLRRCGEFQNRKNFKDKNNHYADKRHWHITENVRKPIIDRETFENVQRILENTPVKRPDGDGYIHPLSGLLYCKDCGSKLYIRIDRRKDENRHIARCSEYAKGNGAGAKSFTQHQIDCDTLMENIAEFLRKTAKYSLDNRAEFEALLMENLTLQQTDKTKKQQKRIPQITSRLEQIDTAVNKLYEDICLKEGSQILQIWYAFLVLKNHQKEEAESRSLRLLFCRALVSTPLSIASAISLSGFVRWSLLKKGCGYFMIPSVSLGVIIPRAFCADRCKIAEAGAAGLMYLRLIANIKIQWLNIMYCLGTAASPFYSDQYIWCMKVYS